MLQPEPLAAHNALFLDLDGTLLEFADSPDAVRVPNGFAALLKGLSDCLQGATAIISGRPIEVIDRLTGGVGVMPAVAGLHGAERRDSRGVYVGHATIPEGLSRVKIILTEFVRRTANTLLEDKAASLALHYRLNPGAEEACLRVAREAATGSPDLMVCRGNGVVEVRPKSISKDKAIAAFMAEPPFLGRTPIFIGDDITDEDGFEFVRAGNGIAVLAGPAKLSHANARLGSVDEVHAWLRAGLWVNGNPNGR